MFVFSSELGPSTKLSLRQSCEASAAILVGIITPLLAAELPAWSGLLQEVAGRDSLPARGSSAQLSSLSSLASPADTASHHRDCTVHYCTPPYTILTVVVYGFIYFYQFLAYIVYLCRHRHGHVTWSWSRRSWFLIHTSPLGFGLLLK